MNKFLFKLLIFIFFNNNKYPIGDENKMILKLKDGDVKIQLFPDVAPNHVEE